MGVSIRPGDATWAYGGFMRFRERLAEAEGLTLRDMVGFGGTKPWEFSNGNPITTLKPLLDHSDSDGYLAAWECEEVLPRLRSIVGSWPDDDEHHYDKRQAASLIAGMEHCVNHGCAMVFS